jgi:hypothetical protein
MFFTISQKAVTLALAFALGTTLTVFAKEGADQKEGYDKLVNTFLEPNANWVQENTRLCRGQRPAQILADLVFQGACGFSPGRCQYGIRR